MKSTLCSLSRRIELSIILEGINNMNTKGIYLNEFDEALSHLIAFPENALEKLRDNKIKYLYLIVNNARYAGLDFQSIKRILTVVNEQVTGLTLNHKTLVQIADMSADK